MNRPPKTIFAAKIRGTQNTKNWLGLVLFALGFAGLAGLVYWIESAFNP